MAIAGIITGMEKCFNIVFDDDDLDAQAFEEAHFWIHMMEEYYHFADPFRWHLNGRCLAGFDCIKNGKSKQRKQLN